MYLAKQCDSGDYARSGWLNANAAKDKSFTFILSIHIGR